MEDEPGQVYGIFPLMKIFLLVVFGIFGVLILGLYLGQAQFIYFPRSYSTYTKMLSSVDQVRYDLDDQMQVAFLLKRESNAPPKEIWWFFGGNGSLALNWVPLVEKVVPDRPDTVFVLVDYPGYGYCRGRPNPERIQRAFDDLYAKLSDRWGLSAEEMSQRSSAMGHSLGAAVALDSANRYDFGRVVAISPFTTMKAMARKQLGGFFELLLSHHYNNETSIDGLLAKSERPEIILFHGDRDPMIPIQMGLSLAARANKDGQIAFSRVPGATHNNIIAAIEDELSTILKGGEPHSPEKKTKD